MEHKHSNYSKCYYSREWGAHKDSQIMYNDYVRGGQNALRIG